MKTGMHVAVAVSSASMFGISVLRAAQVTFSHAFKLCRVSSGSRAVRVSCSISPNIDFSGYGAVKANGQRLSAAAEGQPLSGSSCNGSAAQKWAFGGSFSSNDGASLKPGTMQGNSTISTNGGGVRR